VGKLSKILYLYIRHMRVPLATSLGAAIAGLALSHTIGKAVAFGMVTRTIPFFRTPKLATHGGAWQAVAEAREELYVMLLLWGGAIGMVLLHHLDTTDAWAWLLMLLVQSLPYLAAVLMSWMAVLARAAREELQYLTRGLDLPEVEIVKAPECGSLMIEARAGGGGRRFNAGEATVTRCVVRDGERLGYSYSLGRDKEKARLAAILEIDSPCLLLPGQTGWLCLRRTARFEDHRQRGAGRKRGEHKENVTSRAGSRGFGSGGLQQRGGGRPGVARRRRTRKPTRWGAGVTAESASGADHSGGARWGEARDRPPASL
jgi:hypothetical protein